jgi:hypothetical protein
LHHSVHELDFERLNVFFLGDWQLGLFADSGDASRDLLHDTKRCREFLLQLGLLLALNKSQYRISAPFFEVHGPFL